MTYSVAARQVLRADAAGLDLFVLDAPHLFDASGRPLYGDRTERLAGQSVPFRGALPGGGAASRSARVRGFAPDIVHAHDWQAGLTAAYLAL